MNDVVVSFFFVHGGHDLVNFGADRRMGPFSPVQEGVVAHGGYVEVVWVPHCHDT
jgi:hypothetical protein